MAEKIPVVENIMSANDRLALENRNTLDAHSIFAINMMASPGAGKTSLIEQTVPALAAKYRVAVVDGDLASNIDADRAAAAGAMAVQINTGGGCHLDAVMLKNALEQLDLDKVDILIVENVGNLVCPAGFQLGTHKSVLVASVPEGDDKPYKYPTMYRGVDTLVVNKIDLLPYIKFNMEYFKDGVKLLNPDVVSFPISCVTEEGVADWLAWIEAEVAANKK
jgi:hydrogenase nickel incorporation protein HypB